MQKRAVIVKWVYIFLLALRNLVKKSRIVIIIIIIIIIISIWSV